MLVEKHVWNVTPNLINNTN